MLALSKLFALIGNSGIERGDVYLVECPVLVFSTAINALLLVYHGVHALDL